MKPISILQATTPTFKMRLPAGTDLMRADDLYFTLFNEYRTIEKTDVAIDADHHNIARVELAQRDTVELTAGMYSVRLQWTYGAKRAGTKATPIIIIRNEIKEVLPRGNRT